MGKEKEKNKNGSGTIIFLIILVIALGGYIVYDKIISNKDVKTDINDSNTNNNNNSINYNKENEDVIDDNNKNEQNQKPTTYKAYNLGDKVNLLDSSNWNVWESLAENDEFVTLINSDNINKYNSITFKEAPTYVSTTYKSNLITSLNANNDDIKDARLLTLEDISKLSRIEVNNLVPGVSLENNVTPSFLYQSTTITSKIDENDCPIMICESIPNYPNNQGRICEETQTDKFQIRPVITISKKYIKLKSG